jgi:biotin carboxyl carrier protein
MRKFNISVNGKTYEVEVEEVGGAVSAPIAPAPAQVQTAAPAAPAPAKEEIAVEKKDEAPAKKAPAASVSGGETVACPMPGTILSVNVKVGDTVKKGDVMFILEAMKMENEIMAPHDAKVVSVGVNKGESVNTGDMLAIIK